MSFPISPSDGQIAIVNNIQFQYNSANNFWVRLVTPTYFPSNFAITNQTPSVSNTTGALTIAGGLGVGANVYANSIYANNYYFANGTVLSAGGGSSSGFLANSVIFANSTGVLINTNALSFTTSNNTLIAANITVPTLFTTSGGVYYPDGTVQITAYQGTSTDSTARTTATAAFNRANTAFDFANTVNVFTQSAYNQANSATSGLLNRALNSGYLANGIIFSNTTGYLSNTSSILYYTSNNNLVLTGNIVAGGARTTSATTPPTSPTVGDIWYNTTSDTIARYTYDGTSYYWIDISGPTVTSNTSSSGGGGGVSASGFLANSVIFANSTGFLSNTNNLIFYSSNNNLVLTGNIVAGGARTTTSSTSPANPTVGDIWYNTTSDTIARYTYDGTSYYWIDISGPSGTTITSNSSSGGVSASGFLNNSVIFANTTGFLANTSNLVFYSSNNNLFVGSPSSIGASGNVTANTVNATYILTNGTNLSDLAYFLSTMMG